MTRDKKTLYILSIITFVLLAFALFVDIGSSKIVTACLLLPLTPIIFFLIRKRRSMSINKREVLLVVIVVSVIYVVLLQISGVFFGFYKNPYFVNTDLMIKFLLPCVVIIVGTEIIRYVLLSQQNKFVDVLVFLSCIIAEVLMVSNLVGISSVNKFMDVVGMTLFPAISANVYYHHMSKNYGALPNIIFRIIVTQYIYFIPTVSAISDALSALVKIIFPLIMLAFISALFAKKKKNVRRGGEKLSMAAMLVSIAFIASVAMLVSCQFRFGALVIATDSMTGEINKGDMIIYEQYDDQNINVGQVVVFMSDNQNRIVHRVIRIEIIDGETRYYTKGDFNEEEDYGYRTDADIVGLTDIKVAYVGYPTLWLREIISK